MKCERCNNEIKEGELFCSNCGAKVEMESTTKIDIRALKDENTGEEDKDIFNQKDLEKKSSSVNGFLIFLIILLIAGGVYLIFFDNAIIKRETIAEEKDTTRKVNYGEVSLILDEQIDTSYQDNKLFLHKEGINASFYKIEEEYQDIIKDARELTLKWNEQGLKIDEHKESDSIYEFLGTYKYNNFAIFITSYQNETFVLEVSFSTVDIYNQEKDSVKGILKTIQSSSVSSNDILLYPEFNLNPLGSQ